MKALPLAGPELELTLKNRFLGKSTLVLFLSLLAIMLMATAIGAVDVPLFTTIKIMVNQLPFLSFKGWSQSDEIIILTLRLPRVLLAGFIGGGLAVSGAVLQALFRNPMADPGIIGVSSGGALAAVIALATGFASIHPLALPAAAFLGSLGTLFLVYAIAARQGRTPVNTLLLSGIAVGIFMSAVLSFILTRIDSATMLRELFFWLMGGLDGQGWTHVQVSFWPIFTGSFLLLFFSRDLNLLYLEGTSGAQALGMNVGLVQGALLILSAIITGTAVAFSGTVPFVGLIVPHVIRLVIGPNHLSLLPATFFLGGILLVSADLAARTLAAPEELRLGTITALIGVPFFLYLLQRGRNRFPH